MLGQSFITPSDYTTEAPPTKREAMPTKYAHVCEAPVPMHIPTTCE